MSEQKTPADAKTFDIFLSYKSDDFVWVNTLRKDLQERGVRVWLDKNEIRPGDLFAQALEDGLQTSGSVGLVITPKSMASGWVREEYYRALSLTKEEGLQLIPLVLEGADLPGFLSTRQHIDFRNGSSYEQNVDRLVWPGITGKQVTWFAIHGVGSWPWPALGEILRARGLDIDAADYVESSPRDIYTALEEGDRVVAVVDVCEGWPERDKPFRPPETYAEAIFKIRSQTRGTREEVVFVLYQNPAALGQAASRLSSGVVDRLSHYFLIPRAFGDYHHGKTPTKKARQALESEFTRVWLSVQRELMNGYHARTHFTPGEESLF